MAKSTEIPDFVWVAYWLKVPVREYKFHPERKWRIDFAYPDIKLAIEIEGAVWIQGRHTRGSGFVKDIEKYNALTELGWHLLRYPVGKVDYEQVKRCCDMLNTIQAFEEAGKAF